LELGPATVGRGAGVEPAIPLPDPAPDLADIAREVYMSAEYVDGSAVVPKTAMDDLGLALGIVSSD